MPDLLHRPGLDVHLCGQLQSAGGCPTCPRSACSIRRSARRRRRWPGTWSCRCSASRSSAISPPTAATSAAPCWKCMSQDYIRTAKSKGLPRREIVFIHALKNASLPIVTVVGWICRFLLGGAVVTETHLRLAGHGAPVPGPRLARRHAGGDGHPDADRRRRWWFPDPHRHRSMPGSIRASVTNEPR